MNEFHSKSIRPTNRFKKRVDSQSKFPKGKIILGILILVLIWFLFTKILPRVTVMIIPETENIEREFEIKLAEDVNRFNSEKNVFSADVVEVELKTKDNFDATGEKDIGDKAQGQATFYNQTGRPQPLTNNLDLIHDSGIIFQIIENTTVPGAKVDDLGNIVPGEISIPVSAKEPGEDGNKNAGRLNISVLDIEKQSKIYAEVTQAISGGTSKKVKVVSQEDLDNAKQNLIDDALIDIKEKISKKVKDEMFIDDRFIQYDDSQIVNQIEIDKEVDDFDLELNIKARVLVYNNKELRLFLKNKILETLNSEQTIAETEFGNLEIQIENFDISLGVADLNIKATFPVAKDLDLEKIQKEILGKKEIDARRYILSLEDVKNVQFKFSLSFTDKIPSKTSRVKVILGEVR